MNKRRSLLVASVGGSGSEGIYDVIFGEIPPESTEFEFPLYITVPFDEYNETYDSYYYYKAPSTIIEQLRDWFFNNAEVTTGSFETSYDIYNPNIYINGVKVEQITASDSLGMLSGPYCIIPEVENTSGYTREIMLNGDNSIYIYLYH